MKRKRDVTFISAENKDVSKEDILDSCTPKEKISLLFLSRRNSKILRRTLQQYLSF